MSQKISAPFFDLYLAQPRGFCGGVRRAINLVEQALQKYGAPVSVRHEIVHSKHVVDSLRRRGVVFVEDFSEVRDCRRPVIISAHGAPADVYRKAEDLGLKLIDATCPLVEKVHKKIRRLAENGQNIVIIGKADHPEIIGTAGQIGSYPNCRIIRSTKEAEALDFSVNAPLGIVTQTTLSIEDVVQISAILRQRFHNTDTLSGSDTCYATTYRQAAVREVVRHTSIMIVVGSKNSSNSRQLQKIALEAGAKQAYLIDDVSEMPWDMLEGQTSIGLSAGASAPEELVGEIINALKKHYANLKIHDIIVAVENVKFKSPAV